MFRAQQFELITQTWSMSDATGTVTEHNPDNEEKIFKEYYFSHLRDHIITRGHPLFKQHES